MAESTTMPKATFPGNFWDAPLAWVALAWTAGIVVDRYLLIELSAAFTIAGVALVIWLAALLSNDQRLSVIFLGCAIVGAGMMHHHLATRRVFENDVSRFVNEEPRPAKLWGRVDSEPVLARAASGPLQSIPGHDKVRFILATDSCDLSGNSLSVSGMVQVTASAKSPILHVGDRVRVLGHLARPAGPENPSDFDYAAMLNDQGIRTVLFAPEAVALEEAGWRRSFFGWLGAMRSWGTSVLEEYLPADRAGVATALLLGDGSAMTRDDWQKYVDTGVVHVLVVSGQHLVILACFLEVLLCAGRLKRRWRALIITAVLVGYAFLVGGRPPIMRAAWMVAAGLGGMLSRRPVMPANSFALAWLGISLVHPADIFDIGCQWSFLAVLFLIWGLGGWMNSAPDAMQRLEQEARPLIWTLLRNVLRWLAWFYLANLLIWAVITPLSIFRYNHVTPVAVLLGPPVVILTSIALVTGFLILLGAIIFSPIAYLFAWPTSECLWACERLVDWGGSLPGAHFYVPDLPLWWVALFHAGLILALTVQPFRRHWRWSVAAGMVWALVSCVILWGPKPAGQFRCTFLAVGHGGCTVIETAAGHVVIYDTGTLTGPDVTRRHIAPFLWRRGYWRIDDVLISHADADHFNGLPALLDFFTVRQITTTPFFAERDNQPVKLTLEAIERRKIPIRQVSKGDRWQLDNVALDVLHPPAQTRPWSQNARSMVLRVEQGGQSLLLTGDLQDQGLELVTRNAALPIDVLMAPHHGSKSSNTAAFARWANPQVVISCQRRPKDGSQPPTPYESRGIPYLGTWPHGAISIVGDANGWRLETFRTAKAMNIR